MAFLGIIALVVLAVTIYLPQYWVARTMRKHGGERPDLPGTGGELAQHLIDQFKLDGVGVESTSKGDHYDPEAKMVRLSHANHLGRSLTAVAVAAHEVGHAIQHHRGERGLKIRQGLIKWAMVADRFAAVFFVAAPILALLVRAPAALFAMVAIGIAFLAIRILVHAVTLPVEYDASFNKALPILEQGGYLQEAHDMAAARSVLKAAAYTYVAAALVSLLDLARWVRILR